MRRTVRLAAVTAALIFAGTILHGEAMAACSGHGGLLCGLFGARACSSDCCACWCPDDYCPKPPPCVCLPSTCGCCDDYCPKVPPCVCLPSTCGCCDDYCPKAAPCVTLPCGWPSYYKCPPPLRQCVPCTSGGQNPAGK